MLRIATPTEGIQMRWWHSPASLMLYFVVPFFLLIAAITPYVIENAPILASRVVFLESRYILGSLCLFLAFVAGTIPAGRKVFHRKVRLGDGCLDFLFYVTVAAYLIWFGPLVLFQPGLILDTIRGSVGAMYDVRDNAQNISGVTTATQFGISYAIIYAIKQFQDGERLAAGYHWKMGIVMLLAIFRAAAFSERIAIVEVAIPIFVVYVTGRRFPEGVFRFVIRPFPFVLYTAAPIFFAIFEYPRSWINRYIEVYDNFPHFVMDRFMLYYVTSLNNICALLEYSPNPTYKGGWTLNWLYRFPVVGKILSGDTGGSGDGGPYSWFLDFLNVYASPEYNNTTGFLTVVYDWGWLPGLVLMAVYGAFAGLSFASFRSGQGALRYIYPIVLYSIFEILRIGYIYDGRAVAAIIGVGIALVFWAKPVTGDDATVGANTVAIDGKTT